MNEEYDFIGELHDTWMYYEKYVESGGNEDRTIEPEYIGEEDKNGHRLYGVRTVEGEEKYGLDN